MAERNTADLACFLIARRHSAEPLSFGALPADILARCRTGLEVLAAANELDMAGFEACSMMDLIVDWYCLRQAGHQADRFLTLKNRDLYLFLAEEFGDVQSGDSDAISRFLSIFLGVLHDALQRLLPSISMTDTIELQP